MRFCLATLMLFCFNLSAKPLYQYRACDTSDAVDDSGNGKWKHVRNQAFTVMQPYHAASDFMTTPGQPVEVEAKFSYGSLGIDLFDEDVELWIADCESTTFVERQKTDSDGRARFLIPKRFLANVGRFRLVFHVVGDGSRTNATLYVWPKDTKVIVYDIDGTLTKSDSEMHREVFMSIFNGKYVPKAREGACETTKMRALQGYEAVYLSSRHYFLTDRTRDWLISKGCTPGLLRLAQSARDIWPSNDQVGKYKAWELTNLATFGFKISAAYVNSPTDLFAFESTGVCLKNLYVAGTNVCTDNSIGLGDDYLDHLHEISTEPDAVQPFVRRS